MPTEPIARRKGQRAEWYTCDQCGTSDAYGWVVQLWALARRVGTLRVCEDCFVVLVDRAAPPAVDGRAPQGRRL